MQKITMFVEQFNEPDIDCKERRMMKTLRE